MTVTFRSFADSGILRRCLPALLASLCLLATDRAEAGDVGAGFNWGKTYAGLFVGTGLTGN